MWLGWCVALYHVYPNGTANIMSANKTVKTEHYLAPHVKQICTDLGFVELGVVPRSVFSFGDLSDFESPAWSSWFVLKFRIGVTVVVTSVL